MRWYTNALLVYWSSSVEIDADLDTFLLLADGVGLVDGVLVKTCSLGVINLQSLSEHCRPFNIVTKCGKGYIKKGAEEHGVAGRLIMASGYSRFRL